MRFKFVAIAVSTMAIALGVTPKTLKAQIPVLPGLPSPSLEIQNLEKRIFTRWIYLDGRRLFQVAATRAKPREDIQSKLNKISQDYFASSDNNLQIDIETREGSPVIEINGSYLMTITQEDANVRGIDRPMVAAEEIKQLLMDNLQQGKQERQKEYLIRQGEIAAVTIVAMIVFSGGVYYLQRRLQKPSLEPNLPVSPVVRPLTIELNEKQQRHLSEVKRRLFQLTQASIWGGGSFFILGLFPYTRLLQTAVITVLQIPLRLGFVVLLVYVAVRLSYALIDRFTSAFVSSSTLLTPDSPERLKLRVSTISGVAKSIVTFIWVGVGFLLALTALGIDVVPLLAGASLIGVGLSLASQNLIKDTINGFLIILEDQYALGDVINVGEVGGLVENLNLRMTQVRDAEGRLITIPNSEIKIVANLSSRWSRADLTIPVGYQTDVEQALDLIAKVAYEMDNDPRWDRQIIETPEILGVDNFGDRGLLIRVWIKTQPLKQWNVAREFRRRLKIAFDQVGIHNLIPQQAILLNSDRSDRAIEPQPVENGHRYKN